MFERMKFIKQSVKNPLAKIKQSIKDISKQIMIKQKFQIIQIVPNQIYHITYPTQNNIHYLLNQIKNAHQFQIWNVSQYPYSQKILELFLGQGSRNSDGRQVVYNLTYQYFANIPFCQMIKAIQNIQKFLSLNPNNKVYIHCQQNKRRSAVLLQSYIYLSGIQTDFVQSILRINKVLNISFEDKQESSSSLSNQLYKSQHLILKNLMNYISNNSFINKNTWYLKKILLTNTPKIQQIIKNTNNTESNQHKSTEQNSHKKKQIEINFKILLEIRTIDGLLYKKIFANDLITNQAINLKIPQNQNLLLKDDFLIIIKYVYDKKAYSILRSQLNTNFIYDSYFRVQRKDMDLSVTNSHSKNQSILMDILLQQNCNQQSELSKLNILKDSSQKQSTNASFQQKTSQEKNNHKQNNKQSDQQDFKILDEEQQAEHNQKMQKQIQQQLKKQLQKLKGKKSKQQDTKVILKSQQETLQKNINQQVASPSQQQSEQSEQSSEEQEDEPSQQQKQQQKQEVANQTKNKELSTNNSKQQPKQIKAQVTNENLKSQNNLSNQSNPLQKSEPFQNLQNVHNLKNVQPPSSLMPRQPLKTYLPVDKKPQTVQIKQQIANQTPVSTNIEQKNNEKQQQQQSSDSEQSSQQDDQQQQQQQSQQQQQQQEQQDDLDNYLEKLQKQADKHD